MTALLASKPSQAGGEASIAIRGAAYRMSLEDLPEWAVIEACRRAIRAPDKWAPNPGELRALTESVLAPFRAEQYRNTRILSAKPRRDPTPEERARVAEKMGELVRGLKLVSSFT